MIKNHIYFQTHWLNISAMNVLTVYAIRLIQCKKLKTDLSLNQSTHYGVNDKAISDSGCSSAGNVFKAFDADTDFIMIS